LRFLSPGTSATTLKEEPIMIATSDAINRLRRVIALIGTIGIAIVLFLTQKGLVHVILLYTTSIILATILQGVTVQLQRMIPLSYSKTLSLFLLSIFLFIVLFGWLAGPSIGAQAASFVKDFPHQMNDIRDFLTHYSWGQRILKQFGGSGGGIPFGGEFFTNLTKIFSLSTEAFSQLIFIALITLFVAYDPQFYLQNGIRLFFPSRREQVKGVAHAMASSLRQWMVGRAIAMVMIGMFTYIGLLIAQIPLALSLAILAGLLDIIPFIGPFISAVPAIMVGFSKDPASALWVVVIYLATHFIEDLISPLIQKRVASIPPALLVSLQVFFTLIGGILGLFLTEPLCIIAIILIQIIYIRDFLGEPIRLLHERNHRKQPPEQP
jgi:predicted PurR-regulated permease PerM